ncbi:MAG TPA: hypothetical protein VHX61_08325 [Rhizomicrobium sp.]|jgi:hypothetical protein|nr:hypothetical protein [Rhizomicrobium sp.]
MNDERLDDLLRTPLAPIEDAGFSAAVMTRVERMRPSLAWLEIAVLAVSALLALFFLPVRAMTDVALQLSAELANSTAAAMACLAIVVSVYLLRKFETD